MTDALQWLIDLTLADLGKIIAGLVILALTIELVFWFREHLS
jgi:hypothetical protein